MSKTQPDSNSELPASPGSLTLPGLLTLPGRTLDSQPALPILPEPDGPISRALTAAEFQGLAEVPPELEWFANIRNEKTRRAYQQDVKDFTGFVGIARPEEFRTVTRAHLIAWRKDMESRTLAPSTIRRKLAAISSLFDYLCEQNAVLHNPVDGVKRPKANNNEGLTPALGDAQARALLDAPPANTLKGQRDRAILATLLYHGLRREELCKLRVRDIEQREWGSPSAHFRQGRQDPLRAGGRESSAAHQGVSGSGGAWKRSGRSPLSSGEEQLDRNPQQAAQPGLGLPGSGSPLRQKGGHQYRCARLLRAFVAGDGGDKCLGAQRRYCQSPGVVGTRQCLHYKAV